MLYSIEYARRFGDAVMDFIYPNVCFHCGMRISGLELLICRSCWTKLPRNHHHTLASGDKRLSRKKYFSFVGWRFTFDDVVRELIHLFKFDNYPFLHKGIGLEMAETVTNVTALKTVDMLVPVPLHRARMRERGYNQSLLLAQVVSENTGIPLINALERIKNNRPQVSIEDKKEKERNVMGVFAVKERKDIHKRRILLVDDLFTTGATSNECSKVLKQAGAGEVIVLTAVFAG